MALGLSNRQIAHELYLSVDTIKTHVRSVFSEARGVEPDPGGARRGRPRCRPACDARVGLTPGDPIVRATRDTCTGAPHGMAPVVVDESHVIHERGHDEQAAAGDLAPIGQLDVIEDAEVVDIGHVEDPGVERLLDPDRERG